METYEKKMSIAYKHKFKLNKIRERLNNNLLDRFIA